MIQGTYWYLITHTVCPVCGREEVTRERQYTPRPDDWYKRNVWADGYDWCDAL